MPNRANEHNRAKRQDTQYHKVDYLQKSSLVYCSNYFSILADFCSQINLASVLIAYLQLLFLDNLLESTSYGGLFEFESSHCIVPPNEWDF